MTPLEPAPSVAEYTFEEITEGLTQARSYEITSAVYTGFLVAFGDVSPIHVDRAYALTAGFPDVVAHGAILNGFLSHFVGVVLPGRRSLLLTVDMRYLKPCFVGDRLELEVRVVQKAGSQRVVVSDFRFENRTRGWTAARGRAQIFMRDD